MNMGPGYQTWLNIVPKYHGVQTTGRVGEWTLWMPPIWYGCSQITACLWLVYKKPAYISRNCIWKYLYCTRFSHFTVLVSKLLIAWNRLSLGSKSHDPLTEHRNGHPCKGRVYYRVRSSNDFSNTWILHTKLNETAYPDGRHVP